MRATEPPGALRFGKRFGKQCALALAVAVALVLPPPSVELDALLRPPPVHAAASLLQQLDQTIPDLFSRTTPSVVYISTFSTRWSASSSELSLDARGLIEIPQGTGTGFVWDQQGHIVTNYHVIRNAQVAKVTVTGRGGVRQTFAARVAGADPNKDIAVLELLPGPLEPEPAPTPGALLLPPAQPLLRTAAQQVRTEPVELGSSASLRVGQVVLAIGNPYGLDHTLTAGIVSGLGREMVSPSGRPIQDVIQTDAAINPGNSGGPLLDLDGRVVGMNTAIYSPTGTSAGIGFAIPVDVISAQVRMILEKGSATRAILGVSVLSGPQVRALGIEEGILVLRVPAGSEAAAAGLRGSERDADGGIALGDVIVSCDGRKVNSEADLFRALDAHAPGDAVTVSVVRGAGRALADGDRGPATATLPALERRELRVKLSAVEIPTTA